jgi:uncharacterized protein
MRTARALLWRLGWPLRAVMLAPLWAFRRLVSPPLGTRCRFHPSCSAYAEEAIRTRGALRGAALAAWRVLRCSPLSAGGYDPVPASTLGDGVIRSARAA